MQYDYLENAVSIRIPRKVKTTIKKLSNEKLEQICKDRNKAIEKLFLLCSNLTPTIYNKLKGEEIEYKELNANKLLNQIGWKYRKVLDLLIKNHIIETDNHFIVEHKCKGYRYTNSIASSSLIDYQLTDPTLIKDRMEFESNLLDKIESHPIAKILHNNTYPSIILPSVNKIETHLKRLSKNGYTNKKGKKLIRKPKRSKKEIEEMEGVVFIEDLITLFEILTWNGLKIYTVGNNNCMRVIDSLSLMPKIIRQLVLIDGEVIEEADYKCLHPNLANAIYGDNNCQITHEMMAAYLNVPKSTAKKYNLSFFNYKLFHFKTCKAAEYYKENHSTLYQNLLDIKEVNPKEVTYAMFELENKLMSKVFAKLESEGIKPIHVYDAVLVKKSNIESTIEIMNKVAEGMKINTFVQS